MTFPPAFKIPEDTVFPISKVSSREGFAESAANGWGSAVPAITPLASQVRAAVTAAHLGEAFSMTTATLLEVWGATLTEEEMHQLIVPKRTLARRVASGEPLDRDETDRAIRVGSIRVEADRVFGNSDKAGRWLRGPVRALNGQRPMDLLASEAGTQAVQDLLGRIDHGMFS